MTFIVMTLLVLGMGMCSFLLCQKMLGGIYSGEAEVARKEKPQKIKLQIYFGISTLINALLLALSYFHYNDRVIYAFKLAVILQWLIVIALIDFYCYIIPNKLVLLGMVAAILFATTEILLVSYPIFITLKEYFFGLLLGGGVFFLSAVLVKGSVGMGDIKLFAILGLLLGWLGVFSLMFFTVLVSAIYSIFVLLSKKGDKKTLLPLGPFTYAGMIIVLLLGV